MNDKELEKAQFKLKRIKKINSKQKTTIDEIQQEIKALRQEVKTLNRKLDKIVDIIYPYGI